jgi:hypothetical protein
MPMKIMVSLCFFIAQNIFASEISFSEGEYVVRKVLQGVGKSSTTSLRFEEKTVVSEVNILGILDRFNEKSQGLKLSVEKRDKEQELSKNATFTFYGKKLFFYNLGIKTTIKFRMRFYLLSHPDTVGFERSDYSGYLEIKVKNPSALYQGVSIKNRIKLADEDLLKFCQLVGDTRGFKERMAEKTQDQNKKHKIENFFNLVEFLSAIDQDFTRFNFATSYERSSLKIIENKKKFKKQKIEYQFTMDRQVKSYLVNIDFSDIFSFSDFFKKAKPSKVIPDQAVVVEVKIPVAAESLSKKYNDLKEVLFDPVLDKSIVYSSFKQGKGKYYHLNNL